MDASSRPDRRSVRFDRMILYRIRPTAILDVAGDDREAFLQGQLTQDVRRAVPGAALPAAGLTPKGKLVFVARLVGLPDRFRLLLAPAVAERALAHLAKYAVFQKVSVGDRTADFIRVGVVGSSPAEAESLPVPPGAMRLGPEGEFSDELLIPAGGFDAARLAIESAGAALLDDASAETLRVESGRPEFGVDFDDSNLPDEVGLTEAISTTKGCYVGQEIVARMRTYGRVNRRLVGFRFPDGLVGAGSTLARPGEGAPSRIEPGRVTSAVDSARFGPIGLGWASRDVSLGDALVAGAGAAAGRRALATAIPFA